MLPDILFALLFPGSGSVIFFLITDIVSHTVNMGFAYRIRIVFVGPSESGFYMPDLDYPAGRFTLDQLPHFRQGLIAAEHHQTVKMAVKVQN